MERFQKALNKQLTKAQETLTLETRETKYQLEVSNSKIDKLNVKDLLITYVYELEIQERT